MDDQEASARLSTFADIRDLIHGTYPQFGVGQFGSHPAGLSIYSSDIDVTVVRPTRQRDSEVTPLFIPSPATGKRSYPQSDGRASKRMKYDGTSSSDRAILDSSESEGCYCEVDDDDAGVTWVIDTIAAPETMLVVTSQTEIVENDHLDGEEVDTESMNGSTEEGEVSESDSSTVYDSECSGDDCIIWQGDTRVDKLDSLQDIYDLLRVRFFILYSFVI